MPADRALEHPAPGQVDDRQHRDCEAAVQEDPPGVAEGRVAVHRLVAQCEVSPREEEQSDAAGDRGRGDGQLRPGQADDTGHRERDDRQAEAVQRSRSPGSPCSACTRARRS